MKIFSAKFSSEAGLTTLQEQMHWMAVFSNSFNGEILISKWKTTLKIYKFTERKSPLFDFVDINGQIGFQQ